MPGNPANVSRAKIDVLLVVVEHVLVRNRRINHVAGGRVKNPLRLPRGTGGIKYEKRVFGIHLLARAISGNSGHRLVPPQIAPFLHLASNPGFFGYAPHDDAGFHLSLHLSRRTRHRLVRVRLHRNGLGTPEGTVCRNQSLAVRINNPVGQGFCGKTAEHNRVHRPDPGARQHCYGRFRHHGHVNRYAVPFVDPAVLENVCKLANLLVQRTEGYGGILPGFVPFPNDRGLVGSDIEVPVDAIVTNVCLCSREPLDRDRSLPAVIIMASYLIPLREPMKTLRQFGPKTFGIVYASLIKGQVIVHASDVRSFGNAGWRGY